MGGPRTDFAYPRVIEAELLAAGQPAEVRVTAAVGQRTKDSLKSWEREVVAWSPDVVVLHCGQYEAIHLFMPWWLERYVNNVARRPGVVRDAIVPNVEAITAALAATEAPFADIVRMFLAGFAEREARLPIGAVAKMVVGESRNFPELARVLARSNVRQRAIRSHVHRLTRTALAAGEDARTPNSGISQDFWRFTNPRGRLTFPNR